MDEFRLETERLILRAWRDADVEPFAAMGRDPDVMRFLGPPATLAETQAAVGRMVERQRTSGHCFWAIERKADAAFLGFCGLVPGKPPIDGAIEIGWRLACHAWGQGYASEAAAASLAWGWAHLPVAHIVAITVPANMRSRALMERLGMVRFPEEDFRYPDLTPGEPPRAHILYRIARPGLWRRAA